MRVMLQQETRMDDVKERNAAVNAQMEQILSAPKPPDPTPRCPETDDLFEDYPEFDWSDDRPPVVPPSCPPGEHRWTVVGPVRLVRGTPAGRMFCVRCHLLRFSWLPKYLRAGS